jgi:hypothetical protein
MRNITCISLIISLLLLLYITTLQNSFSLVNSKSPFSESTAKIKSISSSTSDGKYFVNLQYGLYVVAGYIRSPNIEILYINGLDTTNDKQSHKKTH